MHDLSFAAPKQAVDFLHVGYADIARQRLVESLHARDALGRSHELSVEFLKLLVTATRRIKARIGRAKTREIRKIKLGTLIQQANHVAVPNRLRSVQGRQHLADERRFNAPAPLIAPAQKRREVAIALITRFLKQRIEFVLPNFRAPYCIQCIEGALELIARG